MTTEAKLPPGYTAGMSRAAPLLRRCPTMIYGPSGVGKTSLACSYPKPGLLSWDPDHMFFSDKLVEAFAYGMEGWAAFQSLLDKPEKLMGRKTLIIDGVGSMHDACSAWTCKQMGIDHPEKAPQGRGWALVEIELKRQISRLVNHATTNNAALLFLCHHEAVALRMLDTEYTRIQPALKTAPDRVISKMVALCWYLGYDISAGTVKLADKAQAQPMTTRKSPDLRATGPKRILIMDGGERIFTKMRQPADLDHPVFPAEVRQLPPTGQYLQILKLFAEGLGYESES